MKNYTIFVRVIASDDPRLRWYSQGTVDAISCSDALRRCGYGYHIEDQYGKRMPPRACLRVLDQVYMAWPTDRIDFDHYDVNGNYISVREAT